MGVKRVMISIPDSLLKDIDEYCEKYSFDRSEFFKMLARKKVYAKKEVPETTETAAPEKTSYPDKWTKDGFCEGHFEKGKTYPLQKVRYEDHNGDVVMEKMLCPKCVDTYKMKTSKSGVLYIDNVRYDA